MGHDATNWYGSDQATLGDRIAAAREAAGLSKADLARRLGVRKDTVAGWEEDRSEPRANRLSMLSGMLNVSMRWLLSGEGDGVEAPPAEPSEAEDLAVLLAEMRKLRSVLAAAEARARTLETRLEQMVTEGAA